MTVADGLIKSVKVSAALTWEPKQIDVTKSPGWRCRLYGCCAHADCPTCITQVMSKTYRWTWCLFDSAGWWTEPFHRCIRRAWQPYWELVVLTTQVPYPQTTTNTTALLSLRCVISQSSCRCFWFLPRDAMIARYLLPSCLSVRLSIKSRSSTKTAKRRTTLTTPHDSPGTLVPAWVFALLRVLASSSWAYCKGECTKLCR